MFCFRHGGQRSAEEADRIVTKSHKQPQERPWRCAVTRWRVASPRPCACQRPGSQGSGLSAIPCRPLEEKVLPQQQELCLHQRRPPQRRRATLCCRHPAQPPEKAPLHPLWGTCSRPAALLRLLAPSSATHRHLEVSKLAPRRLPEVSKLAPRRLPEVNKQAPRRLPEVNKLAPRRLLEVNKQAPRRLLEVNKQAPR
ncbi:hypothetical protein SKAU_G00075940, partial [Synaphobranchus kaupii]